MTDDVAHFSPPPPLPPLPLPPPPPPPMNQFPEFTIPIFRPCSVEKLPNLHITSIFPEPEGEGEPGGNKKKEEEEKMIIHYRKFIAIFPRHFLATGPISDDIYIENYCEIISHFLPPIQYRFSVKLLCKFFLFFFFRFMCVCVCVCVRGIDFGAVLRHSRNICIDSSVAFSLAILQILGKRRRRRWVGGGWRVVAGWQKETAKETKRGAN